MGFAGYPTLRLMALAETGTRGLLGAALGSAAGRDEATVARRLLPLLRPGMLILLDRAFDANAFPGEVAATGALLLARAKSTRHPAVLSHLPDGADGVPTACAWRPGLEPVAALSVSSGARIRPSQWWYTETTGKSRCYLTAISRS
jgi:hypothetical protein